MTELELRELFNSTPTTLRKWKVLHKNGKSVFAMQKTIGKNHGVPALHFVTLQQAENITYKRTYKLTSKNELNIVNVSIATGYEIEYFNKILP